MFIYKKIMLLSGIILVSFSSFADCEKPINEYDETYCMALEMVQLDKELNDSYKSVRTQLNENQKSILKKAQIRWIKQRDNRCSITTRIEVPCVNEEMKDRIAHLKSLERECRSTGCDNNKLAR